MILILALRGTAGTSRLDVKGEVRVERSSKDKSTDARNWGGLIRSSDEVLVMRMERRGRA